MRLGIDIGGTKINAGLFDETGDLLRKLTGKTSEIAALDEWIEDAANKLTGGSHELSFCGIGVPGTVSEDGKTIIKVPNADIPSDLCAKVEARLGIPCVAVQDSRAAAWGEYLCGTGKGAKLLVCVTLGTGIGTGIVANGKIYNGTSGSAGELGHIPCPLISGESLRECGCGKIGCTEKYAAGGGLDITARENGWKDSHELLDAAEAGDQRAIELVAKAIEILGRTLTGAVNLIDPDVLLLSGGLSDRDIIVDRLIDYVSGHRYSAGNSIHIGRAALGADSPLYGAAMIGKTDPERRSRKTGLSVSIMCADFLDLGAQLKEIEAATSCFQMRTMIHCDIMDNHFVPNLMLAPELCNKLRAGTGLLFDYHIMCEAPESVIERLDVKSGDIISIHAESTVHLQRVLSLVKSKGAIPAVAINPATPLSAIEEVIDDIGMVLVMTVNPGFAGQKLVTSTLDKVKRLRKMLDEHGKAIPIEVDGNCSFENIPKMYEAGADIFVVGTSSLFDKNETMSSASERIFRSLE